MRRIVIVLLFVLLGGSVGWSFVRPSNDRSWAPEQSRLPTATFDGSIVAIDNIRDFDWSGDGPPVEQWDRRSYDLDEIESLWFVLTPFATDWRGPAHAFLSFGFADSQFVAISIEARREVGESYSIVKGLLKRFEMTYIVGDERDLIGVRTRRQRDEVYVYPIRAEPEAVRRLFTDMLGSVNRLAVEPEWYGTLRNNCTTAILDHVNGIGDTHIPYSWRVLLPGYSDELALELGLLDTDLTLDAARERFRINDRVRDDIQGDDFSTRIRAEPDAGAVETTIRDGA
jgi:hypothetical protein